MITRIWRGWTTQQNAAAYQTLLLDEIFPGIASRGVAGYKGISLLRRDSGGEVEFVTVMRFDSIASVRAFAGEDFELAVVPPRARVLLARFEERSAHYETIVHPPAT
jgi:antibiotic biosynthesis monooxygenase (ABM) superfamily enzyme